MSSKDPELYYVIIAILCRSEAVSLVCIDYLKL